ncbi:MAG: hypothetical protein KF895_03140 [Parvibaculum sp.]|nr:hypothetical protein [Parvibaculum sp.]
MAKIPDYVKRGKFEIARKGIGGAPDYYEKVDGYLVGALGINRATGSEFRWQVSHVATGFAVPCAYGRTLNEAFEVARALGDCLDWSNIRRTETVGKVDGIVKGMGVPVVKTLRSFPFLEPLLPILQEDAA